MATLALQGHLDRGRRAPTHRELSVEEAEAVLLHAHPARPHVESYLVGERRLTDQRVVDPDLRAWLRDLDDRGDREGGDGARKLLGIVAVGGGEQVAAFGEV